MGEIRSQLQYTKTRVSLSIFSQPVPRPPFLTAFRSASRPRKTDVKVVAGGGLKAASGAGVSSGRQAGGRYQREGSGGKEGQGSP